MESFVYLTGAVYIAVTLDRGTVWVVEGIEGRR